DGGRLRPGGDERARDDVEDQAHPDAVTAPLEAANGAAAELKRGGPVVDQKRDRGRPDEVAGALIAERCAELTALAQAVACSAGVAAGYGRADGEQAAGDQGGGADLVGQRECLVRQPDGFGVVTEEQVIGHGEVELDGGVGEVATGPCDASGLFGPAA